MKRVTDLLCLYFSNRHGWFLFPPELLSYEAPETYNKELWQMDEKEKLEALPKLKESGNKLYRERRVNEAAKAYAQALGILEQLLLK